MKRRLPLRARVLLLALLNAVLLASLLIAFARAQLSKDFYALLLGESRERITDVAAQLGRELRESPIRDREALLQRYESIHNVTFHVFNLSGTQIAGRPVTLPESLEQELKDIRERTPLVQMLGNLPARGGRGARGRGFEPPPGIRGEFLSRGVAGSVQDDRPFFAQGDSRYWAVVRFVLVNDTPPRPQPALMVMATSSIFTPLFFNLTPWFILLGLAIAITLACWLPMIHGTTRSLKSLSAATVRIAAGSFRTSVDIGRTDEIGQLGESFNRMAGQLDGFVHGQKRFLRDAAHELRSPLSRMQAALGNILESEVPPETEPFVEDLRQEVDLMSSLTGELLTLAREEGQLGAFKPVPVNLSEIAARAVLTEDPAGHADVRVRVPPDITVMAHAESLFRGLSNFVRNAIRYAAGSGPITITAEQRNGGVVVIVSDQGPGIPPEALELIFTPFFRLDVSRDRKTGGSGLGMAIGRACIESCGGTVFCRNARPGLDIVITLPER